MRAFVQTTQNHRCFSFLLLLPHLLLLVPSLVSSSFSRRVRSGPGQSFFLFFEWAEKSPKKWQHSFLKMKYFLSQNKLPLWGGRVSPQFMLTGYTRFLKNSLKCGGGGVQFYFLYFFLKNLGGRKIVIRRQTHSFLINEIYCVPNSPFSFLL